MTTETEAGAEAGQESFDKEFEAARVASEAAPADGAPAVEGGAAAPAAAAAPEPQPGDLAPLPPEELRKRLNDQQGATRQERQRRRQVEETNRALEARLAALEAGRAPQATGEPAPERPNPEEDPVGYVKYIDAMLQRAEAAQAQEQEQTQAQQQAQRQMQAVVSRVEEFETDFREANPDYDAAANHLYEAKKAEYVENGYSPGDAHTAVMGEFISRSRRALESGKDPAEIVYTMAKRAGYASKAGDNKLDAIENGQRRQSPLAGGGGGGEPLSIEAISNLKGAAFDAAFAKLQERAEAQGL